MNKLKAAPKKERPAKYAKMPPLIPDTPENIAKAILSGPPKKEWKYLREPSQKNMARR